ncbi:MAG: hypothetical protein E6I60_15170 [Chloroflexi bacterium]|nr:MAG: hypothetical protein E6I60_15170 [Chloroflexota bacterium]
MRIAVSSFRHRYAYGVKDRAFRAQDAFPLDVSTNLSADLLEILACPACKGPLLAEPHRLACRHCQKAYPLRGGIVDFVTSDPFPPDPV